jgi:Na+-transporting NADH:ubiquinone oxidoreductase subunit NqrC
MTLVITKALLECKGLGLIRVLYAAVAVGLDRDTILGVLDKLSISPQV